jgi:DNA-binding XRE family transcriptional regulator
VAWRRHQVRLTQAALAAQLGLGRTQVVQIENGRYVTMRLEVLAALAQALRTSADFLLGLTDDPGEVIPPSPPETPPVSGWKLWYHNISGPAGYLGTEHGKGFLLPTPQLKGVYATGGLCQEALDQQYGAQMTQYQKMSMGGKNIGIGKLERSPNKYHWELGMPTSPRSVYEAWCAYD